MTIPIVLKTEFEQTVTFRIFDVQNFDDSQAIFIHDILNDTYVNLRTENFDITLPTGTHENRFEVVFQDTNSLSNTEFTDEDFTVFQNNNANELVVNNPNALPIQAVTLYDIAGKQIFSKQVVATETRLTFSTKNLSDGVYVAKIETETENANSISKKVIIKN